MSDEGDKIIGGYLMAEKLRGFLRESLMIEGIHRAPSMAEIDATLRFLGGPLDGAAVLDLQRIYAPGAPLRDEVGMNVRVGRYHPPPGCDEMRGWLEAALSQSDDPHTAHVVFEKLHPFLDGNGRTGRAIWTWHMLHAGLDPYAIGFLHRFYYQTLERS